MPISFSDNRTIYSVAYGALCTGVSQGVGGLYYNRPSCIPLVLIPATLLAYAMCTAFDIGVEKTKEK